MSVRTPQKTALTRAYWLKLRLQKPTPGNTGTGNTATQCVSVYTGPLPPEHTGTGHRRLSVIQYYSRLSVQHNSYQATQAEVTLIHTHTHTHTERERLCVPVIQHMTHDSAHDS